MNASRERASAAWTALTLLAREARSTRILALLDDEVRNCRLRVDCTDLHCDFSRERVDAAVLDALLELAEAQGLKVSINALLDGEPINLTEDRAALHTALRAAAGDRGSSAFSEAQAVAEAGRNQMRALVDSIVHSGNFDNVIHVGIGGSELGPRLVSEALSLSPVMHMRSHFVANVDAHGLVRILRELDAGRTLVVLVSKSFKTAETLLNAETLLDWFVESGIERVDALAGNFVAVTSRPDLAAGFGIVTSRILPFRDWVGGRYSLWSPVGFSIALQYGMHAFDELLAGAREMDLHFASADIGQNAPVLSALIGVWNRNFMQCATRAVVPYDDRLRELPAFLQQLEMESNGKSVDREGHAVAHQTVPVVWGSVGSNAQHAWFQALHQGTQEVPVDFVGVVVPDHPHLASHRILLAHMLAQAAALLGGSDSAVASRSDVPGPHEKIAGDHPSSTLLLSRLTPRALGALLAFHEHRTFVQSVIWDINAFDQFGVELGKRLADVLVPALEGAGMPSGLDPSTRALVQRLS